MADTNGRQPGDPGYDASSDPNNTDNGDGTFTDGQGNVMDSSGGLLVAGPGMSGDTSGGGFVGDSSAAGTLSSGGAITDSSGNVIDPTTGTAIPAPNIDTNSASGSTGSNTQPISSGAQQPGQQPQQPAPPKQPQQPDNSALAGMLQKLLDSAKMSDAQFQAALQAATAANAQDFAEKVREFNANHDVAVSQITGTFNGQPTLAAQQTAGVMANGQPTEAARQFNVNTATDLAKLASSLSGPADYFKFLNATNAGRNILTGLTDPSQVKPAFGGFSGSTQPLSLSSIFDSLGIGGPNTSSPSGTGQPSTSAPGFDSGGAGGGATNNNMIQLPNNMGYIPQPQAINPSVWDSWGTTGQAFIKSAAAAAGWDPNVYEQQVNATRPGGASFGPETQSAYAGAGGGGQSAF